MLYGSHFRELMCLYIAVVTFCFVRQAFVYDDTDESDRPFSDSLGRYPRFAALATAVRADFGWKTAESVEFPLSPVAWRLFGCSAAGRSKSSIIVPIGCLGIFSIFDLKCELAHALTRSRSRIIVSECERSRHELKKFAGRPHAFRDRPRWQSWAIARIEAAYETNLARLDLFSDLQADQKVASKYGCFAVSSWIQRSQLAYFSVRECVINRIVPLAEEGVLVPVAGSCREFHALFENEWLDSRPLPLCLTLGGHSTKVPTKGRG
jgi:hypothetical protein